MKNFALTFFICLFLLAPLHLAHPHAVNGVDNHNVDIPNAVLRGIIETNLFLMSGDPITADKIAGRTGTAALAEVVKSDQDINDLTGLEHATELKRVQIGRNRIRFHPRTRTTANTVSDLSPLKNLSMLTHLDFSTHRITDLSPLANLTMLHLLDLTSNWELANISHLSGLTSLRTLHLDRCSITDTTAIGTLTGLRVLWLGNNPNLRDISPLANLGDLRDLRLNSLPITGEDLSAVLPALEGARRQEQGITYWAHLDITNTEVSDLSVLDQIPDGVLLHTLYLQYMGTSASGTRFFLLKDLTPLVDLMKKGKVVGKDTLIQLRWNFRLDYPSLYEDIPTLLGTVRGVQYLASTPSLEKESPTAANYEGAPGTRHTFVVRAINDTPYSNYPLERTQNRTFSGVPVTWEVTNPDGTTETHDPVLTGDDGLSEIPIPITLGSVGEKHTVKAIVPANMPVAEGSPSHGELIETFTVTAVEPPVITLTLDEGTVTRTSLQWIAEVSGTLPSAYVHYYKKSAATAWIKYADIGPMPRRFGFAHLDLEPATSYDFQLFALKDGEEVSPSNILTASTLGRRPPPPEPPPPEPPPPEPVNNPPVFRSASAVDVLENTTAVITVIAEDPDAEDEITGYAITGGADASLFEISGTDMLRFKTAPDFEMPGSAANSNVYTVILTATSGVGDRALTATQTLTVTVTDVDERPPEPTNRPPVFRSASAVNVQENTTAVVTVVAEDPDVEDVITGYAITGGGDASLFEISGTRTPSDMLRFKSAPDFEMPVSAANSNVYTLILTATSGVGDRELTATQTLTVTVTDVDETPPEPVNNPPVFRSASAVNVQENTTAVVTVLAEDPDAGDAITGYAITGGADALLFEIGGTGTPLDMLRFKSAPDFEMPGSAADSNVYTLILTATSGAGDRELTATQTLTVTVTDVDERPPEPVNRPPVFRSASAVSVQENTTAVVRVVAEDPDTDDEITGYAITGGADASLFEISGTGTPLDMLRFKTAPDFEMPGSAANSNVYTLILTATSGAGDRELTATQTLTVTVTDVDETPPEPVNRPPVFKSASAVNVQENTTAVVTIVAEDPDVEDAITGYAITGGADASFFEISGTRTPLDMLRFKTAPDFEMPVSAANSNVYTLILTATSGVGDRALTATQTLTVTVTDVDERPPAPPVEPPFVSGSGATPDPRPPAPLATSVFIFNEISNASDDTNDWIELKNFCREPLHLADWQIRLMRSDDPSAEGIDVVSFPDVPLPPQAVLLITNTDPSETRLASGLNIATGARQRGAQHRYLVAERLKLPSTPYLLVLQRRAAGNGDPPATVEDVAGNYFRRVSPYRTEVYPLANTSRPKAEAAPLTEVGTYQRVHLEHPGYLAAAWEPSGSHGGIGYDRHVDVSVSLGTPGYRRDPSPSQPVAYRLAFNEIRNARDDTHDFVELKNICGVDVRLKTFEISIVASAGEAANQDVDSVSFPDYTLPMGGVLLITNTDPSETDLAGGLNIATGGRQRGALHPYMVAPDLKLPSTPYLLILRSGREQNGTPLAIEDVAGNYFRSVSAERTEVWPLADMPRPTAPAAPLTSEGTWQRRDVREPGYLASAWTVIPSGSGLGFDRHAVGENAPGAPGYGAGAVFNVTLPDEVRVSELMFETEGPWREFRHWLQLPQWIEVYNRSETPVNLEGWELAVETRTGEVHRHANLTLKSVWIPPKQTVLLVTGLDSNLVPLRHRNSAALPPDRVYDLSEAHPDAFNHRPHRLGNTILGTEGFFLRLTHPTGRVVDTVGNLDGDPRTDDLPTWTFPISQSPRGPRASLLRRFQDGDVLKGTEAAGWQPATDISIGVTHYYGHPTDISTPGGLHGIVPGASPKVALSISEIMYTAETKRHRLPQWIELYNPSFGNSVNLKDWQLVVETRQAGAHHQILIDLAAIDVLPNQTVLLITESGRHSGHFPANRVYNLPERHPKAFEALQAPHRLLSGDGFLLQLSDPTGNVVDTVGNLDGYPFTEDTAAWAVPSGETSEGGRASIRRLYEKGMPLDGRQREAWVSTADVPPAIMTYYGDARDVGNPGYRTGGPLPVALSRFQAVRNADAVVVSWTTESSLENAGFHLYRSLSRTGGFIRVNPRLIPGAGTTAERQTYTFVDKPPKTDGVYYYQIQEISQGGQQQVLATRRVKGYLSADGKHLTTFGNLKTNP